MFLNVHDVGDTIAQFVSGNFIQKQLYSVSELSLSLTHAVIRANECLCFIICRYVALPGIPEAI